jgi:NADH:ubiquinone reductase (H+-translocating)
VDGREHVWALGDCARVPHAATPEHPDPPTCQDALRQARRLAKNLHGERKRYRYRMLGQVATLGRYRGIADVLGIRLRGFPGWFVTRTYHLFQLPLVSRKLRVVADWTVSLFFRRDIAELSMLGHPARLELPPAEKLEGAPVAGRPLVPPFVSRLQEAEEGAVLAAVVARQHELAARPRPRLERLPRVDEDALRVHG